MGRQKAPLQVNQFVGGINTESNPLNYPPNSSIDEQNMEILRDGSRKRRGGMNVENGYSSVDTGISEQVGQIMARGQFKWENAGGFSDRQLLVVQIGNYLGIHDLDGTTVSGELLFSVTYPITTYNKTFGYAVVDGTLVVGTGQRDLSIFSFDGTTVTHTQDQLLIRDFFGVEATEGGVELTDSQNVQVRPSTLGTTGHLYNLRNQTFALPRVTQNNTLETVIDPINSFFGNSGNTLYPSNADNTVPYVFASSASTINKTVERFHATNMFKTVPSNTRAPIGYFVIDALQRGTSRLAREADLRARNPQLVFSVSDLPDDETPGGASILAQYAGRVWYAGFSAEVNDGDKKSPRMGSYVLFSRVVQDPSQITKCYQEADPTSHIDADIGAADGGFIKIDGAYNIKALVPIQTSIFVFAENGVWRIVGSDGDSFSATSFSVSKVGDEGAISAGSVVSHNNSLFYWSDSSINVVTQNEVGDWLIQDLSTNSVQSLYDDISPLDRDTVVGYFDLDSESIRWLYGVQVEVPDSAEELVLNLKFSGFTKNQIDNGGLVVGPVSVSGGQGLSSTRNTPVTVGGVQVTVGGTDVSTRLSDLVRDVTRSFYCIVLDNTPTITYTFGQYNDSHVTRDWLDFSSGVDTPAFLITGSVSGGDGRPRKNVPYVTTYFNRTETTDQGNIDSSCLLRSQWDWTVDSLAHKWSNLRQAYRPQRTDVGQTMVVTRNKIRGHGKFVALSFSSEVDKALHIYGWEMNIEANEDE